MLKFRENVVGHIYKVYSSVDANGRVDGSRVLEVDVNDMGFPLTDFYDHQRIIIDHSSIEECMIAVDLRGGLIEVFTNTMECERITPVEYYKRYVQDV